VFTASTDRNRVVIAETTTHLFRVRASGGEPEAITSGPDSFDGAVFSPDGKALFTNHTKGGVMYALGRIARISWPNLSKPEILTSSFDRPINGFHPSADSRTIYLIGEEYGRSQIYSMPATGGDPKPFTVGKTGIYTGLDVPSAGATPFVIADWQSMTNPPEVMRIDPKTGERKALTSFTGADIAGLDLPAPRDFWFTASNGKRIHSFVVLPPAFDENKKYPLLVFMHGGPHQAWADQWFLRWNYELLASPGYVVLMTNYTGSPGYGEKFAADINNDVLRTPAKEINEAADEAIRLYKFIDSSRQAAGGASYGGYLANWLEGNTTRYKCLFSHAGLSNNISMWGATDGGYYWEQRYGGPVWESKGQWEDQNPLRYAANFKTPMLITAGALDLRVPMEQSLELFKLLQRKQVPSRFVMFPNQNHWIQSGEDARYFFDEVFAWLKKYL
jgi:dipeptidyl aminopeptidase/acylaminoacyl peptidase